jgi:Mrp family chromosome partitioning ATPase
MGKTLDALKRGTLVPVKTPTVRPAPAEPAAAPEEEIPFIEVGGPRSAIEASRDVMACPAPAARLPQSPAQAQPHEPGQWTIQFRPLSRPEESLTAPPRQPVAELIAFHQPDHAIAAQYRTLLSGLLAQLPAGWGQVLLFTAPAPWAGTTTVLLNLAVTAARQEGRKVAVVDANLRRPALSDRLGVGPTPGLRDVLAGNVPLRQALQQTGQPGLWALPAGKTNLGDVRLPLDWLLPTLRQLRSHFDLVFVDAPSWNEGSEVSALAATCDAVYMVLHQGQANPANQANPLPLLRQPPTNLQGCILTMR